jgi:hypothetical protein
MAGSPRRWPEVLRRWVVVAGGLGAAVSAFLLAAALLDHAPDTVLEWMDARWKWFASGVMLLVTVVALGRAGLFGNLGIRKAHLNPPRWLQIVLFVAGVVASWSRWPATFPAILDARVSAFLQERGLRVAGGLVLVAVAALVAYHLGARLRRHLTPRTPTGRGHLDLTRSNFKVISEWLRTDDEIAKPSDDAFGHNPIAVRIADRLEQAARGALGRCPTFALVGELGSGKSSILKLVEHELHARGALHDRVLVVAASLWPFDSAEAAIRGILDEIERGFARITSVSSIARAPTRYLKAIGKIDKRAEVLAEFLSRERTPAEALEAYGRLAHLVGVHVVVWIEDLERFDGSTASQGSRAAPIRALLYQLQRIERLSVVLASDNLNARVDLQKIARFVESIPVLDTSSAWPIISRFREGCLAMLEDKGQVDPASMKARQELSTVEDSALPMLVQTFGATAILKGAIVHLCRTPRTLKQALREALGIWDSLQGEIDFDDSLLMCVLRTARPDVFALVDEHVDLLRGPSKHRKDSKKNDQAFKAALDKLVGSDTDTKNAIEEIVHFVFPSSAGAMSLDRGDKPQGLAARGPRDYWRRFLSIPALGEAEKDQPVLRAIAEWNAGRSQDLVRVVSDSERSPVAEHFVGRIQARRVVDLLETVTAARSAEPTVNWPADTDQFDDRRPPGIVVVWRMCHRKLEAGELDRGALTAAVGRALEVAMPRNLRLAHELIYFFLTHSNDVAYLLDEDGGRLLFQKTQELLRTFSGDPDRLVLALKDSPRFTLWWNTWGLERIRSREHLDGLPFGGWPELASTVLEAARRSPSVMLPQIVSFLVSYSDAIERAQDGLIQRWTFEVDVARRLFGIVSLQEVFGCNDESLATMEPERAKEVRYVRGQLAELFDPGSANTDGAGRADGSSETPTAGLAATTLGNA